MDVFSFDNLAQFLVSASRRTALRGAVGSAGLAMVGLNALTVDSDAKKKRKRRKKRKQKGSTCEAAAIGQACTSATDCCGTETGNSCGVPTGGLVTFVCCLNRGKLCTTDSECCTPLVCGNGFCAVPA